MRIFIRYLLVYTIIVLFLTWLGQGTIEEGYERLYWFSIFFVGGLFMVPVLLMDIISQLTKRGASDEKETNTTKTN